jgi:hypothetical protein
LTCGYENQSFQDKDDVEQKCDSLDSTMSGVLHTGYEYRYRTVTSIITER